MKLSTQLMRAGQNAMNGADAAARALGPVNSICGGARGLSGTDMQGGGGAVLYLTGRLLRWFGL